MMTRTTKTPSANGIMLVPVKPPIAIGLEYQRELLKLVRKLNKEVYSVLSDKYSDMENVIAKDESPVFQMEVKMKQIFERYSALFKKTGQSLAEKFIHAIDRFDFMHMKKELAKHSLKIRPDANYIGALNVNKALIADNVSLIVDLSEKQYQQIHGDIMRSIANGGDLQQIEKDLRKRGIQTEKRARLIARDQLFKSTGAIDNQRMLDNGITKAIWKHSHGDKVPRPSHLAADGKVFDTAKGCLIDGKYIYPKQEINCFPADASIDFTYGVIGAFKRRYTGILTNLITKSGITTKCTPNHPILSVDGWRKADSFNVGDYFIKVSTKDTASTQNSNNRDTSIVDIFNSFNILGAKSCANMVIARNANFHGDSAINEDVDIILADGGLQLNIEQGQITQRIIDRDFTISDNSYPTTFLRSINKLLFSIFKPFKRIIGGFSKFNSIIYGHSAISNINGFGISTDDDIMLFEKFSNATAANSILVRKCKNGRTLIIVGNYGFWYCDKFFGFCFNIIESSINTTISQVTRDCIRMTIKDFADFSDCSTLLIEFDTLVDKFSSEFDSHVYNLQTKKGFYVANNIISHNCTCYAVPFIEV